MDKDATSEHIRVKRPYNGLVTTSKSRCNELHTMVSLPTIETRPNVGFVFIFACLLLGGLSLVLVALPPAAYSAPAAPSINTLLSPPTITVGGSVNDSALLTGATSNAGGTVTYEYFSGGACSGAATTVGAPVPVTNGVVPGSASQQFITAGSYSWNAVYSGDLNNGGATSPCEQLAVSKATPTLTTQVSNSGTITIGATATDTATVSGGFGTLTGSVTFTAYTTNDCSGFAVPGFPGLSSSSTVILSSDTATSGVFTPPSAGTYYWKAVFNDTDGNNSGVTSTCGTPGSPTEILTVNRASPAVATTLSFSSITAGGSVTDSATLTGAFQAGGTVTYEYFSGGACSGTATVVGTALTVTNGVVPGSASQQFGSAGSYSWNAGYSGDSNNNGATSGCEPLTVNLTGVTVTATLSSSAITVGGSLTDSASLSGGTNNAGGTVTYEYFSGGTCSGAGTTVGTPVPVTNGVVPNSASQQFVATGSYSWNAVYSGDSNNHGAASGCEPLTVNWTKPTITLSLSSSVISAGQSVSGSAYLSGSFNAGGTVKYEYFSDGACTGTATIVGSPVAVTDGAVPSSVSQILVTAGSYSWNAVYSGDSNNNGATSQCESLAVNSAGVSISTRLSAATIAYDSSVTDSATLSGAAPNAGGTVTYEFFSGSYCSGAPTTVGTSVTVTGGLVPDSVAQVFRTPGSYSWNAVYSGDSNDNRATSGCESLTVSGLAATTLTVSCHTASVTVGSASTCKATVSGSGSPPTGTIAWSTGGSGQFSGTTCVLFAYGHAGTCSVRFTPTAAGSPVILTASYGGDSRNSMSSGTYHLAVKTKATKTTVSCMPRSVAAGSLTTITCTARVTGYSPTGFVAWSQSGAGSVSFSPVTCVLSAGSCSISVAGISAGTVTLTAAYAGDLNNQASSRSTSVSVGKAATAVSVSCAPSPLGAGSALTCAATVSGVYFLRTGTVAWSKVSGSGRIAFSPTTCTLSSGGCSVTLTITSAGTVEIRATYSGDVNDLKSSGTLVVSRAIPTIATLLSSAAITAGGSVTDSATLTGATGNAGGTVTYYYYAGGSCSGLAIQVGSPVTVTNGAVPSSAPQRFNAAGSYSWNAVYSGDQSDSGAASGCELLTVNWANPSISLSLSSSAIFVGRSAVGYASLTGGFNAGGTVTYEYFSGTACAGPASIVYFPVTVTNGAVPPSLSQTFYQAGNYSWNAVYSGDSNNHGATSECEVLSVSHFVLSPSSATGLLFGSGVTVAPQVARGGPTVEYEAPRVGRDSSALGLFPTPFGVRIGR